MTNPDQTTTGEWEGAMTEAQKSAILDDVIEWLNSEDADTENEHGELGVVARLQSLQDGWENAVKCFADACIDLRKERDAALARLDTPEKALREITDHPKAAGRTPLVVGHNTGMERLQRIARQAIAPHKLDLYGSSLSLKELG